MLAPREALMRKQARLYDELIRRKKAEAELAKDGPIRDMVAASLFPFAIDQSSRERPAWRTDAERRARIRDIARICFDAADKFIKVRNEAR